MNRSLLMLIMLFPLIITSSLEVLQTNANPIPTPMINLNSPEARTYNTDEVDLIFESSTASTRFLNITLTSFSYSLDDKPRIPISGNTTLTGLSWGTHSVVVYGVDTSGETHASQKVNFDVHISSIWMIALPLVMAIILIIITVIIFIKKRNKRSV